MTRIRQRAIGWCVGLVAVGLIGGCGAFPSRKANTPPPHPSSNLLDSGPTPKVTGKQAAEVQFALGRGHEEADRLDQAEAAYRQAVKQDPKRADIEARLAIVLDRKAEPEQADKHFERALKLDPKNAEILCDRGYCFYLRGKNAEAAKTLQAALAIAPKNPRCHTNLGLVHAARGESEAAMAEFARAGTDVGDSRANLALALALDGKVEAARDQYAKALAAKPGSKTATDGLRVASTIIKKGSASPTDGLPSLPGDPTAPLVAAATPQPGTAPRVDSAVVTTSLTR